VGGSVSFDVSPTDVPNLASFLDAIEAQPADDSLGQGLARLLEDRSGALGPPTRLATGDRFWSALRKEQLRLLDRRQLRQFECDCVERILPYFERAHPGEPAVRTLLKTARRHLTGRKLQDDRQAVLDWLSSHRPGPGIDLEAHEVAFEVARLATWVGQLPRISSLNCAYFAIAVAFGMEARRSPVSQMRPEWLVVRDAEMRWQIARILRLRLGPLAINLPHP
jgi:hypothetical protein